MDDCQEHVLWWHSLLCNEILVGCVFAFSSLPCADHYLFCGKNSEDQGTRSSWSSASSHVLFSYYWSVLFFVDNLNTGNDQW